jgi:thymidine phosphorylase
MIESFAAVEIIAAKRDRNELTDPQIDWVVDAYPPQRHEFSRNIALDKCDDQ